MKNFSIRFLRVAAATATAFLVIAFCHLAWTGFISDSEIWAVTIAKNLRGEWFNPWVFTRILFYAPLGLATAPFQTATSIFTAAKVICLLNGLLILFFSYRLARRLSQGDGIEVVAPWLAVILILANSGFLNQGYRIRSDLFSCSLVLLALERTLWMSERLSPKRMVYWALPLLTTPKAVLHILPAFCLLKRAKDRERILQILFLGLFLIILIYPTAFSFFLNTYTAPETGTGLLSGERLVYLKRMLTNSSLIICAFGLRFVTWATRIKIDEFESDHQKSIHVGFGYFTISSLILLVLSPEKVPFFIASFIPVFSVFTSLIIDDIQILLHKVVPAWRKNAYQKLFLLSIFLTITATSLHAGINWNAFRKNNNSNIQFNLIRAIEAYLNKYPKATYYDVVGLVPQRASIRLFAGPNDPTANRNTLLMLTGYYQPDLIFRIQKMHYLQPGITEFLNKNYFSIGTNSFARWSRLKTPLRLPLKNNEAVAPIIGQMKTRTGTSSLPEFTVLIGAKGKSDQIRQLREEDLFNPKITGYKARLLAISPFTKIDAITALLPTIIRFDWDWTGAKAIED